MDGKARDSIVNECISKMDADSDSEKQMDTIRDFASSWYIGKTFSSHPTFLPSLIVMQVDPILYVFSVPFKQ